jgi:hypothetical protein
MNQHPTTRTTMSLTSISFRIPVGMAPIDERPQTTQVLTLLSTTDHTLALRITHHPGGISSHYLQDMTESPDPKFSRPNWNAWWLGVERREVREDSGVSGGEKAQGCEAERHDSGQPHEFDLEREERGRKERGAEMEVQGEIAKGDGQAEKGGWEKFVGAFMFGGGKDEERFVDPRKFGGRKNENSPSPGEEETSEEGETEIQQSSSEDCRNLGDDYVEARRLVRRHARRLLAAKWETPMEETRGMGLMEVRILGRRNLADVDGDEEVVVVAAVAEVELTLARPNETFRIWERQ